MPNAYCESELLTILRSDLSQQVIGSLSRRAKCLSETIKRDVYNSMILRLSGPLGVYIYIHTYTNGNGLQGVGHFINLQWGYCLKIRVD